MGLLDQFSEGVKMDLVKAELKKIKTDNSCERASTVVSINEKDEISFRTFKDDILTHLKTLEARNEELSKMAGQAQKESNKMLSDLAEVLSSRKKAENKINEISKLVEKWKG